MRNKMTPVYILSGFLGSGKTTLLTRLLQHWKQEGLKPAVVMNEIGEVNIDSLAAGADVPTSELLSGCVCCTIRADFAAELGMLLQRDRPDVIVVEATGAANPMEILDGVAEASLYLNIELQQMITVVDTPHLLHLHREQRAKTYRLMQEQIRCANVLILNKADRLSQDELSEVTEIVEKWNRSAAAFEAVRCHVDLEPMLSAVSRSEQSAAVPEGAVDDEILNTPGRSFKAGAASHDTHAHVMSYTHHLQGPLDSRKFEAWIRELPRDIYRAKGILTFQDTASRYLFQYAFRETDYTRLPQEVELRDVLVFIGEQFDRTALKQQLQKLSEPT
ncbi:CobW family GTP-binding protein [Paenibacillus sp. JSM ZJ436]|uniref:CobW family GTP-binding protein n=1 Tax=Paenibacillus sp. JSM ZJ436 TaxID=3376190 RepID=UPI00378B205C